MANLPISKTKLEQFVRDAMMHLQDEYSLTYPTSNQIVIELKRRGWKISIKDKERIKEMREIVKEDVNDLRFI